MKLYKTEGGCGYGEYAYVTPTALKEEYLCLFSSSDFYRENELYGIEDIYLKEVNLKDLVSYEQTIIKENYSKYLKLKLSFQQTKWFETIQIETPINVDGTMSAEEIGDNRRQLIIMHQCDKDNKALIDQLKTVIYGLENGFDDFAC